MESPTTTPAAEPKHDWLHRERMLLGDAAVDRLTQKHVLLFGIGGVGSYALEALVRAGIGKLTLVDNDTVSETNLNRQLIADRTTIGKAKVAVAADRAKRINPAAEITALQTFVTPENARDCIATVSPDYIIDAIDNVSAKLALIVAAKDLNIPIISCMGTGSKLDPTRLCIADIAKTHTCPLAKVMRIELRKRGIPHCDVVFSDELPAKPLAPSELEGKTTRNIPGSISFVPPVAGMIAAGYAIRRLTGTEDTVAF